MMPTNRTRTRLIQLTLVAGALAVLATGADHLEEYTVNQFSSVPTIGTLFLLNFIGGTVLGLYLLVPASANVGRFRRAADALVALAGLGLAATGLISLFVSEQTPLFGFMEHGYRIEIVVAIVAEAVAIVALSAFLLLSHHAAGGRSRVPSRHGGPVRIVPAGTGSKP